MQNTEILKNRNKKLQKYKGTEKIQKYKKK